MPLNEPPTLGEVFRALSRIEQGTAALHDKLDARPTWADMERLEKARADKVLEQTKAHDAALADLRADIDDLQENQRKVAWAIVGTVLAAVLGIVLGFEGSGVV